MQGYAYEIGNTAVGDAISGNYLGPSFFNNTDPTGTLIGNFTDTTNSTITGHEGDNAFFDPIFEATERLYFVGEMAFDIVTAGFVINVMDSFTDSLGVDFPAEFSFGLQVLMGFINIWFIVYIITGRSIPSFT